MVKDGSARADYTEQPDVGPEVSLLSMNEIGKEIIKVLCVGKSLSREASPIKFSCDLIKLPIGLLAKWSELKLRELNELVLTQLK